jgi:2-phosphoglycerate kinase
MAKPIVLIGGASGAGKSTLAGRLKHDLGLDHFLGTGFVRAIVQSETTPERDPALFSMTFQAPDPVEHIITQAKRLEPAVRACIERARREGTSMVVEGTHLIPALYHDAEVDLYLVLRAPELDRHSQWVRGKTHTKRQIGDADIANIRLIDAWLAVESASYGITTVHSDEDLTGLLAPILSR